MGFFGGKSPKPPEYFGDGDGVTTLKMLGDTFGMGKPQNFGGFLGKTPENPKISGMEMGLQLLKCLGTLWGQENPKFQGFFGLKSPIIPRFQGGDEGRNIRDFPHTSGYQSKRPFRFQY